MGIIDRLIEQQYAAVLDEPDRLIGRAPSALLGGAGLTAIAEALAGIIQRPVLILNAEFHCLAHSAQARPALSSVLDGWGDATVALTESDLAELRRALGGDSPRLIDGVEQLGLGPGLITAAVARHRPLGYVYVPRSDDLPLIPTLERRALSHAAVAVAMEMLRLRAAAEAESRVRGNFLWSLVAGIAGSPSEVATNAVLLGYDLRATYEVAVGIGGGRDPASRMAEAERVALRLEGARSSNVIVARQSEQLLFLSRSGGPRGVRKLLEPALEGTASSWGIADGAFPLLELGRGYGQATQALEIGTIVHGPGHVTDAHSLGPYLMLDVLARNSPAVESAREMLKPILDYDRGTARDLLRTLEVFLRENGNTSAAARILYLNRHSLRYRLHKIEQLTGRSLEEYEDRFMLDLSLKLLRLVQRHESRSITTAQDGSAAPVRGRSACAAGRCRDHQDAPDCQGCARFDRRHAPTCQ